MSKLNWDSPADHIYEMGVSNGVVYPKGTGATYAAGVAWNGLTTVTEKPSGAEPNKQYADNRVYAILMSLEEFSATVEAYTYPDEFAECDGSKDIAPGVSIGQQTRKPFGMSYRSEVGNGDEGESYGYKLHLIYGAMVSPSEKAHKTINESPELDTFSWELTTTPVAVSDSKPTAHLVIDSTKTDPAKLAAIEAILYGTDGTGTDQTGATDPRLPLPDEVATLMAASDD